MEIKARNKLLWALVGAVCVAPLALSVAEESQGHRGRPGFGAGPEGPMALLRELDLSDDQRQQIRALFEEAEADGVRKRLMEARMSLNDAIDSGADESELRERAYQLGQVEGDAAVERARAQARINEILTDAQRQELAELKREAKEEMAERQKRFEERMKRRKEGSR
jgi:Spy/CpxP family protein refolding chaperone